MKKIVGKKLVIKVVQSNHRKVFFNFRKLKKIKIFIYLSCQGLSIEKTVEIEKRNNNILKKKVYCLHIKKNIYNNIENKHI